MWHPALSKRGWRWAPIKKWKPVSLPNAAVGLGHMAVVLCGSSALSRPWAESPAGSREAGCEEVLSARPAQESQEFKASLRSGGPVPKYQPTNSLSCDCKFSLRGCVSVQFTEFMTFLKWTVWEIKSPKGQVCFQFILLSLFYKRKFYCFYIKCSILRKISDLIKGQNPQARVSTQAAQIGLMFFFFIF